MANERITIFTKDAYDLLNKGLEYNLQHKSKHWWKILDLEADSGISYSPSPQKDLLRFKVAKNCTNNRNNTVHLILK